MIWKEVAEVIIILKRWEGIIEMEKKEKNSHLQAEIIRAVVTGLCVVCFAAR